MTTTTSEYPRGLVMRDSDGHLGMVVDVNDKGPILQLFTEGQIWVPMALQSEPQNPHDP